VCNGFCGYGKEWQIAGMFKRGGRRFTNVT
jgi:hypothetical protein